MENGNIVPRERGNSLKILNEFSMHCSIWPVVQITPYKIHYTFSPLKTAHILGMRKLNPCEIEELQASENRCSKILVNHAYSSAKFEDLALSLKRHQWLIWLRYWELFFYFDVWVFIEVFVRNLDLLAGTMHTSKLLRPTIPLKQCFSARLRK